VEAQAFIRAIEPIVAPPTISPASFRNSLRDIVFVSFCGIKCSFITFLVWLDFGHSVFALNTVSCILN
jgi:hypothetical protein